MKQGLAYYAIMDGVHLFVFIIIDNDALLLNKVEDLELWCGKVVNPTGMHLFVSGSN